jgi:hypothetical protein
MAHISMKISSLKNKLPTNSREFYKESAKYDYDSLIA